MPYTPSERDTWLARIAGSSSLIGGKVIPNLAATIDKSRKAGEEPPSYLTLRKWWESLPDEEQSRLHDIHGTNGLIVSDEAAERCLSNARNLAKVASPVLIEELNAIALGKEYETKDRIQAAKLVFQVAGALVAAPSVQVTVNTGEQEFFARWEKVHGTPIIEESEQSLPGEAIPLLAERAPWENEPGNTYSE